LISAEEVYARAEQKDVVRQYVKPSPGLRT